MWCKVNGVKLLTLNCREAFIHRMFEQPQFQLKLKQAFKIGGKPVDNKVD